MTREIGTSSARAEGALVRLTLVIDGKLETFLVAPHVAASLAQNLVAALASGYIPGTSTPGPLPK